MKRILITTLMISAAIPAYAEDTSGIPGSFSGSVNLTTDYTSRGLTQSDEHAALQGSLTYSIPLDDNFTTYAGVWGSNVDFNDGGEANLELDWTVGVGYTNEKFSFDTGFIYYEYPGADKTLDYEYYEIQANVGYDLDPVFLRAAINYAPDNAANSGEAVYVKAAADYKVMDELKLSTHIGRQYVENNANFGVPDYNDWGASATYTFKEVDFTLEYADNDIDSASCGINCDGKVIFSVSKSF